MSRLPTFILAVAGSLSLAHAAEPRQGLPWDWSHRAIIHHPETPDEAMARGRYGEWLANVADPRYLSQLIRRVDAEGAMAAAGSPVGPGAKSLVTLPKLPGDWRPAPPAPRPHVHRDWSNVMGGASGVGFAGTFPTKYGWDINSAPSCANDFVVYPTASAGVTGSGAFALNFGMWTTTNGTGTVTITNGTRVLTLTASTTQNTGLFFQVANGSSAATRATNLGNAINRNGGVVGVIGGDGSSFGFPTLSGYQAITHGNGGNSISATSTVPGFSWNSASASGGNGTAGQPTIFALNQLYSSCGSVTQPVPATYWSYNTGNNSFVELSPVLSMDGSQVAFVERNGTTASLVLLKWSSTASLGTIGAPTVPATAASAAAYRACTAPCMIKFSLGANDVTSSPFIRYDNDEIYVGDAAGKLHKFTGVFLGTPAQAGAPWPVTVSNNNALSSPVYDTGSGLVFVGSARGLTTGGQLHSVSAAGTLVSSGQLGGNPTANTGATGVADSPVVDSLGQRVYAFVASDTSTSCGTVNCMAVYQFNTNVSIAGLTSPRAQVGRGQRETYILRSGVFDNTYWSSANPASPSGFLYVCGTLADGSDTDRPTLWRIPITGNVMGTPAAGPRLTDNVTDSGPCAPLSEIMNGANDYLYASVGIAGNQTGCVGACIYLFRITSIAAGSWTSTLAAGAGLPAPGGTSGIIIDNISNVVGASQVYYSTLTSPGNAIQASQAALQ